MAGTRLPGSTGERLLRVLEALVNAGRPLSLPELTALVELPKPTVHRLIGVLEDTGYAIKDADERRYVPGPTVQRMALALMQNRPGSATRHLILRSLADQVGEACNIVLLDGDQLTYIDRVDTAWPLRLRFDIGSHVPLHCTATGKLLLSLQPKRVRDRIIRNAPLKSFTSCTITDPEELERAFKRIRRERVGTDNQEFLSEMVAIAVPIDVPKGTPVTAVSIHAPTLRRGLEDLREFLPQLREAARRIADILREGAAEREKSAKGADAELLHQKA